MEKALFLPGIEPGIWIVLDSCDITTTLQELHRNQANI